MPSSHPLPPENRSHSLLSALCDGETAADEARLACAHWQADAQARVDWHTWAVIGDAMRAESLCASVEHDADFVQRLRERLACEPIVLAPAPLAGGAAATRHINRWAGAGAVAAGLAVVAGAVVMLRTQPAGERTLMAASNPPVPTQPAASAAAPADPALAGYLFAHRQYAPTAMPGGVRPVALQPAQP
ncbi:MAG: sigma-E factor negative regulatory protein [Proteobacteria bacterium]|nr:sigma-E factor negative regulatory protein [Pseudomonadota bacterium]